MQSSRSAVSVQHSVRVADYWQVQYCNVNSSARTVQDAALLGAATADNHAPALEHRDCVLVQC
jgi:hypothetical protein